MKDEEVELNTAILAWKKGFPARIGKITQTKLQRWLREVHNLIISIEYSGKATYSRYYFTIKNKEGVKLKDLAYWDSYEFALEQALIQGLNLISKNENNGKIN